MKRSMGALLMALVPMLGLCASCLGVQEVPPICDPDTEDCSATTGSGGETGCEKGGGGQGGGGEGGCKSGGGGQGGGAQGLLIVPGDSCCRELGPFVRASLFAIDDAPCPEGTTEGIVLHANLVVPEPHTCSACSCGPATCELPTGMQANAVKCSDAGGPGALVGPASGAWDGLCSTENALPAGVAQSLTVPALPVTPCEATGGEPALPPYSWGRTLRECIGSSAGCPGEQACAPLPDEGFLGCFWAHGDDAEVECPHGYARNVFFKDVKDDRACEACTCGSPEGVACDATVVAFSDSGCAQMIGAVVVTANLPACVDLPGTSLASAEAYFTTRTQGACEPAGGTRIGGVQPHGPVTTCCQGAAIAL